MYQLSRILLMIGAVAGLYCVGVIAELTWPGSSVFVVALVVFATLRKTRGALTTLGSAHWASEEDLRQAKMLGGDSGLILGRLAAGGSRRRNVIAQLFARNVSAKEACEQLWLSSRRKSRQLVRLVGVVHVAIFGPSGAGKGVSFIIPWLRTNRQPAVAVDLKGENAQLTAAHRKRKFGHRIVLLDPWKVVTQTPDSYNALDFISKDSATAIDECNDLAKALVVRGPDEKEPHWNDSAEAMIAAVLLMIVQYGGPTTRSLQTARDILSDPQKLDMAIKVMCESDCCGGMLARMGSQLKYLADKEKNSVMTTVGRHLRFLDSLAVAESTKSSSFDPSILNRGKMTVYLILPPDHMRAQSALLRVWISSLLRAVVKAGVQRTNEVHFILDEAASLGRMDCVNDAIDKYRGYGVRVTLAYQSPGQLKLCFPEDQGQTLLSNTAQIYFGVSDNQTAEYVSARVGERTIIVESGGTSSGSSTNWSSGQQPQHGGGGSHGTSSSWQQMARKLLKPEEIMALDPRLAITLVPGMPPILTRLARYYEERNLGQRSSWLSRSITSAFILIASAGLCAIAVGAAVLLTREFEQRHVYRDAHGRQPTVSVHTGARR